MSSISNQEYKNWIQELKLKVRSAQIKAAIAVNKELILFYWELGSMISQKIRQSNWGDKILENVSKDLKEAFPEMSGFSERNLKYCKFFYEFYSESIGQQLVALLPEKLMFRQQLVAQIPWGHNILIFTKLKRLDEALFYIQKTIENNWSRDVLGLQIKSNLFNRQGKTISNFKNTLPEPFSDLAQQTLKDPYVFDFLQLTEGYKEKDIENQLVNHIKQFLLELGKGFAFVGQQYHIEIAEKDYYIDLLFYHIKLKCYVVIELKNTAFVPEYAGKLNFYLSAIDSLVKENDDKPTIGILLCREKNNIEAEFSLRDIHKPMGVSEFELTHILPENLKSALPTIEELENKLLNGGFENLNHRTDENLNHRTDENLNHRTDESLNHRTDESLN
ncbi:MAG TPA: PDDEXK nuclease domain-containing protein, partial [Candidatus Kapabacteria bacterium]|nr:PDDEXK nuclease domain-containing protein [Candidatus Kapabacteria bacterium]